MLEKNAVKIVVIGSPGSGKSKTAVSLVTMLKAAGFEVISLDEGKSVEPFEGHLRLERHPGIGDAIANLRDLLHTTEFVVETQPVSKVEGRALAQLTKKMRAQAKPR